MTRSVFHGLRPVLGKAMQRLELAYVTADTHEKRQIEMAAQLLRIQVGGGMNMPLLDPPDAGQADGEVWLGRVLHGEKKLGWVGLDRDRFTTHVGVFGTTGAGKTTACASMLLRLMELGSPWIVADPKRSLRCLKAMPTPKPVTVLTAGRDIGAGLRFNPLALPPGVDASSHIAELVQLMGDTWHGGVGIASVLEEAMKKAWHATANPTLMDVRRVLEQGSYAGRSSQWVQSAHRILKSLTEGRLGSVFSPLQCTTQPLQSLMSGWTIIETDGLTREEASFLVSTLLLQVHQRLQARALREKLQLTVLIDEAEQLLVKRDAQRESLLERMIRVSRESGLSLVVASQSISRMTPTILANLGTLVAMRAHHRDDVSVISRMLMLPDHAVPMLGTLGVGQAVCRVPHWVSPIMAEIPKLQLPKGRVSDAMLARSFQSSEHRGEILSAIEAVTSDSAGSGDSTPDHQQEPEQVRNRPIPLAQSAWFPKREHAGSPTTHDDKPAGDPSAIDLLRRSPDLQRLLRHIAEHPFEQVTRRYSALGLSRRRGNALRQTLAQLGLVRPLAVSTPTGVLKLLELTDDSRSWLRRTQSTITSVHGGLVHAYWQHECRRLLESHGWKVKLEWKPPDSQHIVDIAAWKNGKSLLFEIETGKSNWVKNIEQLHRNGSHHRYVIWLGERLEKACREIEARGLKLLNTRTLYKELESIS